MSLTSYRTAPPRVISRNRALRPVCLLCRVARSDWRAVFIIVKRFFRIRCGGKTWQRPTLPRLKTKYHRRWGVSRPSSEWDRVQPPRHNHQVGEAQTFEKLEFATVQSVDTSNENNQADRAISTGKLHTLLRFHTRPINVVVFHDSQGILVSRSVSRLDAFSGYPFRI